MINVKSKAIFTVMEEVVLPDDSDVQEMHSSIPIELTKKEIASLLSTLMRDGVKVTMDKYDVDIMDNQ